MKKIYICSPYRADTEEKIKANVEYALDLCTMALLSGYAPVVPHLMYTRCLDDNDPTERKIGLDAALELLTSCDELWQGGEKISQGMAAEIALAKELGISVRIISRDGDKNGDA